MKEINIPEQVKVENKKNNDSPSVHCDLGNRYCLSRKIQIEKEKKYGENIKILLQY